MASKPSAPSATPDQPATKPLLAADRIRKTAREMFYRDGIRAVGVDAIVTQAGVTKPSLYRSFSSKDELAATYLRDYDAEFWARFNAACDAHPGDPRAQLLDYLSGLSKRAVLSGYRGCGLTNAAVEYPEPEHPARAVAVEHKLELRRRLNEMAAGMGAGDPEALADGLLLLIEGAFVSSQLFGEGGPAGRVAEMADKLIQAHLPG
ncbi:TetR/AcrR family transcriptional regulator [Achromobacter marplatensis]|jgi:AcrR family transcriptional regulator|uniref:TetR/AcrR family transcriptional regulator n=1 Tax=Achromobacter marplatensis TaxID=470868 RepID=UPI000277DCD6|nr:TetR/AcrR family transcriptional regulator [Achromobacter marplatensis]EJO27732.1 TetR family transcriptional regulator [Achromobacter marplatensis]